MKKALALAVLTAPLFLAACGSTPADTSTPATVNTDSGTALGFTPTDFDANPYLERELATAGDVVILGRDFVYNLRNNMEEEQEFLMFMAQMMGEDPTEAIATHWSEVGEDGYTNLDLLRQATLAQTQERAVMIDLAREAGITYDAVALETNMADLHGQIAEMALMEIDGYQLFYDIFGVTVADYTHIERERLLGLAFVTYLTDQVDVPAADIDNHIASNPHLTAQEARAFHVLVDDADLAESILARINAGESIEELARTYSSDPGSIGRANEPDGFYQFPRGMMVTPFENFAFDNPAGTTGIVPTDFGYHVMLTDGVSELTDEAMLAIRDTARQALAAEQAFEHLMTLVEDRDTSWTVNEAVLAELH